MFNHVKNDFGKDVQAIGAPGSEDRVKVEYPNLISKINNIYFMTEGKRQDEAIELIRESGIRDRLTTTSLMNVSMFGQDENIWRYWDV